jgi:hypothetical protein
MREEDPQGQQAATKNGSVNLIAQIANNGA